MKKLLLILPLVFLLCFPFSCQKAEEVAEEVSPDELIPTDLKETHNSWWNALLNEDTTVISKLLSDDVGMGFGDHPMPRAKFLSHLKSGDLVYDTIEQENVEFHVQENAAVVSGITKITCRSRGDEDFGRSAYIMTYVRADKEWKKKIGIWFSAELADGSRLSPFSHPTIARKYKARRG